MRGCHSAFRKTLEGHSEVSVFSLAHLLLLMTDAAVFCNYQFSDFGDADPTSWGALCVTCSSVCVCLAKQRSFLQKISRPYSLWGWYKLSTEAVAVPSLGMFNVLEQPGLEKGVLASEEQITGPPHDVEEAMLFFFSPIFDWVWQEDFQMCFDTHQAHLIPAGLSVWLQHGQVLTRGI